MVFAFLFQTILTIILFLLTKYLYEFYICRKAHSKKVPIVKVDWKKDVVYLFQFPRTKFTANLSPFCLKLETFLRHHNIKHEIVETMVLRSSAGKLPFVELNGEHLADSQLIILTLSKYFNIQDDLTDDQKGVVRAIGRMLDSGTLYNIYYFKVGTNPVKFAEAVLDGHAPTFLKWPFALMMYTKVWSLLNSEGSGRFSPDEVRQIIYQDFLALDQILGDKQWLVGDQPSLADFTAFGHLSACYNLPYPTPIHNLLDETFPRLKALHDRIVKKYFKDVKFLKCGHFE